MKNKPRSIRTGAGGACPTCGAAMDRYEHAAEWKPRPGQPYYFRYWDSCGCSHMQHYEEAKVYLSARPQARSSQKPLTDFQEAAYRALRVRCGAMNSKLRRKWLAEQMGIEERFAIIAQFDAIECETVISICLVENHR